MDLRGNAATWLGHGTWLWETSEGKSLLIDCLARGQPGLPGRHEGPGGPRPRRRSSSRTATSTTSARAAARPIEAIQKSGAPGVRASSRSPTYLGGKGCEVTGFNKGGTVEVAGRAGDHGARRALGRHHRRRRLAGLRRRRRRVTCSSSLTAWSSTTPATPTCSATWRSSPRSTSRTSASCRSAASTPSEPAPGRPRRAAARRHPGPLQPLRHVPGALGHAGGPARPGRRRR